MWGAIKVAINSMVGKGAQTLDRVSIDAAEEVLYNIMRDKYGTAYGEGDDAVVCERVATTPVSWISGSASLQKVYFAPETQNFRGAVLSGCPEIEELYLPCAVRIEYNAFSNLPSLKTVVLGNKLAFLGSGAFIRCNALQTIFFRGTLSQWEAVQKRSNWKESEVTVYCYDGNTKG